MGLSSEVIEEAYRGACLAELDAIKPGNVHRFAGGHGMAVADFERSAEASAPFVAGPGLGIGARVLGAVEATFDRVGMNTNLGIVLLAAPLAAAAERAMPQKGETILACLRRELDIVLSGLEAADAAHVFAAIARASPGGLGTRDEHDVRRAPQIGLLDAMRIAAPSDRVAAQYADGFADVWGLGVPIVLAGDAGDGDALAATVACYLAFASAFPDSHVSRKYGAARAADLAARMADLRKRLAMLGDGDERRRLLLQCDADLKSEGLNPGTSADLTVASIFAGRLLSNLEEWRRR